MKTGLRLFSLTTALALGGISAGAQEPASEPTQAPPTDKAQSEPQPTPAPPLLPGPKTTVRPDDKRRTMKSYTSNLGYNFLGFFTRGNYKPLLFTAALTGASTLLDDEGQSYFVDHPHDDWGRIGSNLGGTIAIAGMTVGLFSAGRISRGDNFRAMSYDLSQAILVTAVYTEAIKVSVQRERPDGSNRLSFPSGHSSNAFAMATVVARHYPRLAIPTYGLASYIAFSRMAANKHFLSDIVAGSGLGWSVGRLVVRRNGRPPDAQPGKTDEPPPENTTWDVTPWRGPAGDGEGLAVRVSF
jgi:hypothetical protein